MESTLKIATIILAAGKGTRMGSDVPKVLIPVHGVPMVVRVVDAVRTSAMVSEIAMVVSPDYAALREILGTDVKYVVQAQAKGTGHAVACCAEVLRDRSDVVLVLYGDHPFVRSGTLRALASLMTLHRPTLALMTTTVPNFDGWRATFRDFGRVVRDAAGDLVAIVEARDASLEELEIREVNPGMYCFDSVWLWENIGRLSPVNNAGEYYLTDLVKLAMAQGKAIATMPIAPEECLGVNTLEQLQVVSGTIPGVGS